MDNYVSFTDVYNHLQKSEVDLSCKSLDDFEVIDPDDAKDYSCVLVDYVDETKLDIEPQNYIHNNVNSIVFNVDTFFVKIFESYKKSKEEVWDQLRVDLPRTPTFIDGIPVKSLDRFKQLVRLYTYTTSTIDKVEIDFGTFLAMVCNQSSFCFPFMLIHKIYSSVEKDYQVMCLAEDRKIDIKRINNALKVELTAVFAVVNMFKHKTVNKLKTVLLLELENNSKKFYDQLGIFNWEVYNRH